MFRFTRAIVLYIPSFLNFIRKYYIFLLLVILILKDFKIHIYILNNCNIAFNIERFVNKIFNIKPILNILYINLDNSYIRFR